MSRKKVYKKLSENLNKTAKRLKKKVEKDGKRDEVIEYIFPRIKRLSKELTYIKELDKHSFVSSVRKPVDICVNLLNLISYGDQYVAFLDKESEEKSLNNGRDYLIGWISDKDKKSRKKFLKAFKAEEMKKMEVSPVYLHPLRSDASMILHDNQSTYIRKPSKENIKDMDNVLFHLITDIENKLCIKYSLKEKEFTKELFLQSEKEVRKKKLLNTKKARVNSASKIKGE